MSEEKAKNYPTALDSKHSYLRIRAPEHLDVALEGLIRKVLKEQPKMDDIYAFAADYFDMLLKIREKAGIRKLSVQDICPYHNEEDANEMIKLASTFTKRTKETRNSAKTYQILSLKNSDKKKHMKHIESLKPKGVNAKNAKNETFDRLNLLPIVNENPETKEENEKGETKDKKSDSPTDDDNESLVKLPSCETNSILIKAQEVVIQDGEDDLQGDVLETVNDSIGDLDEIRDKIKAVEDEIKLLDRGEVIVKAEDVSESSTADGDKAKFDVEKAEENEESVEALAATKEKIPSSMEQEVSKRTENDGENKELDSELNSSDGKERKATSENDISETQEAQDIETGQNTENEFPEDAKETETIKERVSNAECMLEEVPLSSGNNAVKLQEADPDAQNDAEERPQPDLNGENPTNESQIPLTLNASEIEEQKADTDVLITETEETMPEDENLERGLQDVLPETEHATANEFDGEGKKTLNVETSEAKEMSLMGEEHISPSEYRKTESEHFITNEKSIQGTDRSDSAIEESTETNLNSNAVDSNQVEEDKGNTEIGHKVINKENMENVYEESNVEEGTREDVPSESDSKQHETEEDENETTADGQFVQDKENGATINDGNLEPNENAEEAKTSPIEEIYPQVSVEKLLTGNEPAVFVPENLVQQFLDHEREYSDNEKKYASEGANTLEQNTNDIVNEAEGGATNNMSTEQETKKETIVPLLACNIPGAAERNEGEPQTDNGRLVLEDGGLKQVVQIPENSDVELEDHDNDKDASTTSDEIEFESSARTLPTVLVNAEEIGEYHVKNNETTETGDDRMGPAGSENNEEKLANSSKEDRTDEEQGNHNNIETEPKIDLESNKDGSEDQVRQDSVIELKEQVDQFLKVPESVMEEYPSRKVEKHEEENVNNLENDNEREMNRTKRSLNKEETKPSEAEVTGETGEEPEAIVDCANVGNEIIQTGQVQKVELIEGDEDILQVHLTTTVETVQSEGDSLQIEMTSTIEPQFGITVETRIESPASDDKVAENMNLVRAAVIIQKGFRNFKERKITGKVKSREQDLHREGVSENDVQDKSPLEVDSPTDAQLCGDDTQSPLSGSTVEVQNEGFKRKNYTRRATRTLLETHSFEPIRKISPLKTRSLSTVRYGVADFEVWNQLVQELEEAATKIQSNYRRYKTRKKLQRENAVQSSTTISEDLSLTSDIQEPNQKHTGEFHDSIVLNIHPK